jgi:hypothetical protein
VYTPDCCASLGGFVVYGSRSTHHLWPGTVTSLFIAFLFRHPVSHPCGVHLSYCSVWCCYLLMWQFCGQLNSLQLLQQGPMLCLSAFLCQISNDAY